MVIYTAMLITTDAIITMAKLINTAMLTRWDLWANALDCAPTGDQR